MTYDDLVDDITTYLERKVPQNRGNSPQFIRFAEQISASEIRYLGSRGVVSSTMTQSDNIIPKPARWRKTVSMNVSVAGVRQPVLLRTYEYLREYWPDQTMTDIPKYFGDYDYDHWLVVPTPATGYTYEVLYYERNQPLDSSNQSNWFTEYAPQALLYGSLLQAMPFLKNDERIPMWQAQYDKIIAVLQNENAIRVADRQAIARDT